MHQLENYCLVRQTTPDYSVNYKNGEVSEGVPLIWAPEKIFIDNKYLGCFTGKKLYLINFNVINVKMVIPISGFKSQFDQYPNRIESNENEIEMKIC